MQIKQEREREEKEDTEKSDLSRDELVIAVLCAMDARRLLMCAFVC